MKSVAAKLNKEKTNWNLSWQPDGRCNSFTRESILACAPPASGVYGLFNFDCQIFIGESANIQEALLHHQSEIEFESRHLRPTGFTFELCAAEWRRAKANELIERFRPVLQTGAALSETRLASDASAASEAARYDRELDIFAHREFPPREKEELPKAYRASPIQRASAAALAAIVIGGTAILFYFGAPPHDAIHRRTDGTNPSAVPTESASKPQSDSSVVVKAQADQNAERTSSNPHASTWARAAVAPVRTAKDSMVQASITKAPDRAWSVQIAATPAKDTADGLIRQLKAKGYDGHVAEVEVKGQIFYRVRIGRFDTREQAESARQSLVRQEGYRDAFLAAERLADKTSDPLGR